MKHLSIILPIYNESGVLPELRRRLSEEADRIRTERRIAVEIVLVDDGSTDGTLECLEDWARTDPRVRVIALSRNFGHQAAITAGMDAARGSVVVTMDADLQDPPEVIGLLLDKHLEGYDVVCACRSERAGEGWWKRGTAWLFYRLMRLVASRSLPADAGDFRLVGGEALQAFRSLRERHRFLRGLSSWIGFAQARVSYARPPRAAGKTKFSSWKMLRLAWDAATSFSTFPLTVVTVWGFCVSLFGLAYLVYTLWRHLAVGDTVPGWSTLVVLVCVIGGSILVSLGIIGSYVGKIFEEAKSRPLYLVRKTINCEPTVPHDPPGGEARVDVPRLVGVEH